MLIIYRFEYFSLLYWTTESVLFGKRSMGFIGTYYASMKINSLDLSPNYAGSLMALSNGIGALTGIAAPTFVGFMTPDVSNNEHAIELRQKNWSRPFLLGNDFHSFWFKYLRIFFPQISFCQLILFAFIHNSSYIPLITSFLKILVITWSVAICLFNNLWCCYGQDNNLFNLGFSGDSTIQQSECYFSKWK